jgi:hypothetical protein
MLRLFTPLAVRAEYWVNFHIQHHDVTCAHMSEPHSLNILYVPHDSNKLQASNNYVQTYNQAA